MTKLPNLQTGPGRGAGDEFVHPNPEHPPAVVALYRCYARLTIPAAGCDRPAEACP
jgi:hypothetical protein